jgi:hypothetical protein
MTATPPTSADVLEWLGAQPGAPAPSPELVDDALEVALLQQAQVNIVDPYTAALHYAALRRTARILAARPHTLGTVDAGDYGTLRIARWDAEIQSAEADTLRGGFA